jgi:hypothetical protein
MDLKFGWNKDIKVLNINPDKLKDGESIIIKTGVLFSEYILVTKKDNGSFEILALEDLSTIATLINLTKLWQDGVLNDKEYEAKKKQILKKLH